MYTYEVYIGAGQKIMTQIREDSLINGEYYHIFSRSISKFVIFNNSREFARMLEALTLYQFSNFDYKYSRYSDFDDKGKQLVWSKLLASNSKLVEIAVYCLMPTHFHLILKQIQNDGISKYLSKVLNSYTRYFNLKHKRIGPLWSGRFKNVLIRKNDQILHLTRYIHLNPVSSGLVDNPKDWKFSSFGEYCEVPGSSQICFFHNLIDLSADEYKKFVGDNIQHQLVLSKIKRLMIDDYTG